MKQAVVVACFYQNISSSRPKLVTDFLDSEYDSTVLSVDFCHITKSYDHSKIEGVIKIHVPKYTTNLSVARIWSHLVFAYRVRKHILRIKPDLLYVCLPPNVAAFRAIRAGKKLKTQIIVDVVDIWPSKKKSKGHNNLAFSILRSFWESFRKYAIKNADAVILQCDLYKTYIKAEDKEPIVIPLAKREKKSNLYNMNVCEGVDDRLYICYLGAISDNYDFKSLIQILKSLKRWKPHLEIIGEGEKKEDFIHSLKIADISFTDNGVIYNDIKIEKILSKCYLGYNGFIKSAVIGQSYKSLDYLSMGVPLLNNLKADTWNLIESHKVGFNFDSDSIQDVVNKIDSFTNKNFVDMKKRARIIFEEYFSWEEYCKSMKKVINSLGGKE